MMLGRSCGRFWSRRVEGKHLKKTYHIEILGGVLAVENMISFFCNMIGCWKCAVISCNMIG